MYYALILRTFMLFVMVCYGATNISAAEDIASKDEIDFLNVGQGHAVLVNRVGFSEPPNPMPWAPLLIDAGSTKRPDIATSNYTWGQDESVAIQKISKRILDFWQQSHDNLLPGGTYHLNIIITHPDKDHKDFIPLILRALEEKKAKLGFAFTAFILLGGKPSLYNGFLDNPAYIKEYSSNCSGIFFKGDAFLERFPQLGKSNCITHLFCPKGIDSDPNRWSIIIRLEINATSAMLTGDADEMVKKGMLSSLKQAQHPTTELQSDILLAPHHGAEKTFYLEWDQAVNPRAIVIGSAPRVDYRHPRGGTILQFLKLLDGKGRVWEDRVMPHGCQYSGDPQLHQQIQGVFGERLFDCVPYNVIEGQEHAESEQWHLVWIDLPIYTLWTTGTLYFQGGKKTPQFVDAPGGIMPYVAVSDPYSLLRPEIRHFAAPLTQRAKDLCDQLLDIIKTKYSGDSENRPVIANSIISEVLPISVSEDRELYFEIISTLLNQGDFLYFSPSFPRWVKEAIIGRNRNVNSSAQRLQKAATFMVPLREGETPQEGDPRGTWSWEWNSSIFLSNVSSNLDEKALILKTFSMSLNKIENLKKYIETHISITSRGISDGDLEVLCPFGFPEWLQLRRLIKFFGDITILDDGINIMEFMDIKALRTQGRNFKEIGEVIIEKYIEFVERGIFKGRIYVTPTKLAHSSGEKQQDVRREDRKDDRTRRQILEMKLTEYFPDTLDLT